LGIVAGIAGTGIDCLRAGMNDCISKPMKREIVFEKIKEWVFNRGGDHEL
jgi:hypothetical protein